MNVLIISKDNTLSCTIEGLISNLKRIQSIKVLNDLNTVDSLLLIRQIHLAIVSTDYESLQIIQLLELLNYSRVRVIIIGKSTQEIEIAVSLRVVHFIPLPLEDYYLNYLLLLVTQISFDTQKNDDGTIFFKEKNSKLVRIKLNDINYIEGLANHININYCQGNRLIVYSTMKAIENRLPSERFMRVHNSFIIQLDKISIIEGNSLIICSKYIPVSRSKWKTLTSKLNIV